MDIANNPAAAASAFLRSVLVDLEKEAEWRPTLDTSYDLETRDKALKAIDKAGLYFLRFTLQFSELALEVLLHCRFLALGLLELYLTCLALTLLLCPLQVLHNPVGVADRGGTNVVKTAKQTGFNEKNTSHVTKQ